LDVAGGLLDQLAGVGLGIQLVAPTVYDLGGRS
jgi:hypothetical protein